MSDTQRPQAQPSIWPDASSAWYVVGILALLNTFSIIDRLIGGVIVQPIKQDIAISDSEMGIVLGTSFAILYSLIGLFTGQMADRGNRRNLVVFGVLAWGISTAASGFAQDFWSLLGCRAGVAFGEAVLTPAAVSMIADLFAPKRRAMPTAIFTVANTFGGFATFVFGAAALQLGTLLSPEFGLAPWRLTFVLVAIPPVLLGILLLFSVREPQRVTMPEDAHEPLDKEAYRYILRSWRLYLLFFLGVSMTTPLSYGMLGWITTMLVRQFGWTPVDAAYAFGVPGLFIAVAGSLGAARITTLLQRNGNASAVATFAAILSGLALPIFLAMPFATNGTMLVVLSLAGIFMFCGSVALPSLFVQMVAPAALRGRLMAVFLLMANLTGLGLGPLLVGVFSDYIFMEAGKSSLIQSLTLMAAVAMPISVVSFLWGKRAIAARVAQIGA